MIRSFDGSSHTPITTEPVHAIHDSPVDLIYLFRHSKAGDEEIKYSLRSVAKNLPWVRKVWIFGDRPKWLADDSRLIEQVPHEYMSPLLGFKTPVRNDFLMLALASLVPGLAFDFVRFSDDYIVLEPLTAEQLCTPRALQDLSRKTKRGSGRWKTALWRTYDTLKKFGYAGYNFETHVPQPLDRRRVFEAFMAFRPFQSEDRFAGLLSATTIQNYAIRHHGLKFTWLREEQSRVGFYGDCPSEDEINAACQGKLFLNFDDGGFGDAMRTFLAQLFPHPCKFEQHQPAIPQHQPALAAAP